MGLTKRLYEEQLDRGWSSVGKYICADCLTSTPLKEIVAENIEETHCDYCERDAAAPFAADTDVVMTAHRRELPLRIHRPGQRPLLRDRRGRLPGRLVPHR